MNTLRNMYYFMKISAGHRLIFLYFIPTMLVIIFTEYNSALYWALLLFMVLTFIATLYTLFHYERLMKEDIIKLKNNNN